MTISFPPTPFVLLLALVHLEVRLTVASFLSCDSWFEREVLCGSINVQKDFSVRFQEKDLTYCPDKCQACMNYDQLNQTRTSYAYLNEGNYYDNDTDFTCSGYYGLCFRDEEEYHLHQQNLYADWDGNLLSVMPWEMQFFYEYAHCALDYSKIQNIWKTGDSDAMYERIVRDFPQYSPTVLSRPEDSEYAKEAQDHNTDVGVGPWLVQIEDFLTDEECDAMIEQTRIAIDDKENDYSLLANDMDTEKGSACQSTQCWCDPDDCMEDPVLKPVWKKIEELVGLPFHTHTEPVHFIQYVPGQRYGIHTDAIAEEYYSMQGPRLFTILFYLNDIEEGNGGETCFPQIGRADGRVREESEKLCIQPQKGRAVIWPNILNELPNGRIELAENRTWHEANGIQQGYKYASTVWYHLRNFTWADQMDCQAIYPDPILMEQHLAQFVGEDSSFYDDDTYNGNYYDDDNLGYDPYNYNYGPYNDFESHEESQDGNYDQYDEHSGGNYDGNNHSNSDEFEVSDGNGVHDQKPVRGFDYLAPQHGEKELPTA